MGQLRLKLLGDFSASFMAGGTVELATRKGRGLLAVLALSPGQSVARERLAFLLWSDRDETRARSSLRQMLTTLRKELGEGVLVSDDERVQLHDTTSDAGDFVRLASATGHDDLRRAVELWSGELLADSTIQDEAFGDWLTGERARLCEMLHQAIVRLMPLESGDARVALARRLVALDPLREASHAALMQAYAESGDRAQALAAYLAARDVLKAELGIPPGRTLEALRATLIAQASPSAPEAAKSIIKAAVAILPFANLSGDASRQYLSDGITEDLISLLARFSDVRVVTRNPALHKVAQDAAEIVRDLGANFIVRGAVRASDTRLVVSCQLIDGASTGVLWSERYDRPAADILTVIEDVAVRIVTALGSRLVSAGAMLASRKATDSWSAYDYFLKGRELCNAGKEWQAEPFFAKAVEADPGFALAHAWCAFGFLGQFWKTGALQKLEQAHASAGLALRHDTGEPMSHYAAGATLNYLMQHDRSEDHFQRAMSLNPLDVNIQGDYAHLLLSKGLVAEALAVVTAALARDPYPPVWMLYVRGKILFYLGEFQAAVRAIERSNWNSYRTHAHLAAAYGHLRHTEEAHRQVAAMYSLRPDVTIEEIKATSGFADFGMLELLFDGLRKAGVRE
jgi:DNA-binding SARP family transcriptional activator